jgi:starch synthase
VEPCGEKHLIALRYGTLPVVRETGGLKDVVIPYNSDTGEGNGFSFFNYNAHDMLYTLKGAVDIFKNERGTWDRLIKSAMGVSRTWDDAAREYLEIYKALNEA